MTDEVNEEEQAEKAKPSPLSRNARRALGVLVEKAKTTPDNYPLSLAALVTGCNQKSNRAPKMELDDDDALLALDELRELGAAREIQGSGRVTKYRHAAYDWLELDNCASSRDHRVAVAWSADRRRDSYAGLADVSAGGREGGR